MTIATVEDRIAESDVQHVLAIEAARRIVEVAREVGGPGEPLRIGVALSLDAMYGATLEADIHINKEGVDVRDIITMVRRAAKLGRWTKRHHEYDGSSWLEFSGKTDYGHAKLTIWGICHQVGEEEKVIEARPAIEASTKMVPVWECDQFGGAETMDDEVEA